MLCYDLGIRYLVAKKLIQNKIYLVACSKQLDPFFDKKGVEIPKIIMLLLNTRHFKMARI